MIMTLGCSAARTDAVFADADASAGGDGSYAAPFNTLVDATAALAGDSSLDWLCLTGEFAEPLELDDVAATDLTVYGYSGGALIDGQGEYYALDAGNSYSFSSSLDDLTLKHLTVTGGDAADINVDGIASVIINDVTVLATLSYSAIAIDSVDDAQISDVDVIADAAVPYGLNVDNVDVLQLDDVSVTGSSATGFSLSDIGELSATGIVADGAGSASYGVALNGADVAVFSDTIVTDVSYSCLNIDDVDSLAVDGSVLSECGSYAITVDGATDAALTDNEVSGYSYAGLNLESDAAEISRNVFDGAGTAYYGLDVTTSDTALISNNFIFDHLTAGAKVGESDNLVQVHNNSFTRNGKALNMNDGGDHTLEVNAYNNIFVSEEDGAAFEIYYFSNFTMTTSSDNPSLVIESDYNLYSGAVTDEFDGDAADLAAWQTQNGGDAHSLEGDPLFVSDTDLHLQSGSPAINKGKKLSATVTDDIDGDGRNISYDIGADETATAPYLVMKANYVATKAVQIGFTRR